MPIPVDVCPQHVRRASLALTIGALLFSLIFAYCAITNEISGKATYLKGRDSHRVTRQDNPDKFRKATNLHWGLSAVSLAFSALGFSIFRNLNDHLDAPF